jgi:AcrR family transcriptional regulator
MSSKRLPTAERRTQIAQAALRIISTRGVRRLTSAALAEEVGIADGTIFRHFKDKNEIVDAAIGLFEEAIEGAFPPGEGAPLERLGSFVVMRLALVRNQPEILRLAFNDRLAEAAGQEGAARVGRIVERSLTFVRRCLAEAQERGEITRDAPLALLVWVVTGVIRGAASSDIHRAPQGTDLLGATPEQVWTSLERFLRSTSKEKLP